MSVVRLLSFLFTSINYLALRTTWLPYYYTKVNNLALVGIGVSLLILPIITFVPGIRYIFQSQPLPWELFAFPGLPFAMLLLVIAELRKLLIRKGLKFG